MTNDYPPNSPSRKKAMALYAMDARILLSTLPLVVPRMTPQQVHQVQKVLDAAVVNPGIQKDGDAIYRRSVKYQIGNETYRDPDMVRRAERVYDGMVSVTEADKHIRLDFRVLLAPDALKPVTDNPDEAEYLERVRNTLEQKGVWLRIGQPWVRDPDDPSKVTLDPRRFQVWLSLGYDGDTIPTKTGVIDREALLGTTLLGARYYDAVDHGPVQRALEKEIRRLERQIDDGQDEHARLIKRYRDAFPGVAEISDALGGADLPDRSIWDYPHNMVMKALDLNVAGNVMGSQAFLVVAAIATRNAAQLLADYADNSSRGAGRAIAVLKVAKTAGEIAEIGLAVTGVAGAVRGVAGMAGAGAAPSSVDALAEKVVRRYIAKNPEIAADLSKVRWVPQPKGTVLGGVKAGSSSGAGTGWHKW